MSNREQLRAALSASAGCVPAERFDCLDAADQQHVATCPRCQTELALYREFLEGSAAGDEGAAVSWIRAELERRSAVRPRQRGIFARLWSWRLGPALGIAAVLLGVAVIGVNQKETLLPKDTGAETYRAASIEVVSPVGELTEAAGELVWRPVPGAARYDIRVTEVDGAVVWHTQSRQPRVAVPAALRVRMLPAKTLLWTVTAENNRGEVAASSTPQRFWVKSKAIHNGE